MSKNGAIFFLSNSDIDLHKLGTLRYALSTNAATRLEDTNYFDTSWAADVPNRPPPSPDPHDGEAPAGRASYSEQYERMVAVENGEYVGFLAGRLAKNGTDAFVAVLAAKQPGHGVGKLLLAEFVDRAVGEGKTRLRLMPDGGAHHSDRVQFFESNDWTGARTDRSTCVNQSASHPQIDDARNPRQSPRRIRPGHTAEVMSRHRSVRISLPDEPAGGDVLGYLRDLGFGVRKASDGSWTMTEPHRPATMLETKTLAAPWRHHELSWDWWRL
ncbi:GNAT family N-acetyltransferase [Rhodococcus sp. P1Y]|uniref:GNAT family N-acetyltransferase n=1 Tax=Rhodococcus sp. P1Y TaxID=1302308 RepID=UPI001379E22E|nr:GNAT family N-acetyltransferase [Rhodococcus sp. P1Y]